MSDKLLSLFETDRELYCKYWDSINPFIKYGCMRDEKFYERIGDAVVFKTINDDYKTVKEYLDEFARAVEEEEEDWSEEDKDVKKTRVQRKIVYYVSDTKQQAQYVSMFKSHGLNAVLLNTMIDNHFITFLESKLRDTRFKRIDSDLSEAVVKGGHALEPQQAQALEKAIHTVDERIKTRFESMGEDAAPAIVLLSEESRRMQEMSRMFGGMDMGAFPAEETLVLNASHPLVKAAAAMAADEARAEDAALLAAQIHDLAMLAHRPLEPDALAAFVQRSVKVLQRI